MHNVSKLDPDVFLNDDFDAYPPRLSNKACLKVTSQAPLCSHPLRDLTRAHQVCLLPPPPQFPCSRPARLLLLCQTASRHLRKHLQWRQVFRAPQAGRLNSLQPPSRLYLSTLQWMDRTSTAGEKGGSLQWALILVVFWLWPRSHFGCGFGCGVATADFDSSFLYGALILVRQVVASELQNVCRPGLDHTAFYRLSRIQRRADFSCFR
jgi:hypothetical protein